MPEHSHENINKCWNIGPKGCKLASKIPSFFFVFFKALGPRQGRKVQHLLVTWGRLKGFFLNISALKMPNGKPLGMIFQLLHQ